jgi:hypothetical protein
MLVLVYHLLVTTGLALVASGASTLSSDNLKLNNERLVKGGIVVLLFAWLIIAIWTVVSFLPSQLSRDAPGYGKGTKVSPSYNPHTNAILT